MDYGVSSLMLAPSIAWAQSEPPHASAPALDADRMAATTDDAQRLSVNVRIDGGGPFRFIVDTGADRTVIAEDVAASLGLLRSDQVVLKGIARTLAAETVFVNELSLGSVRRKHLQMPVLPRSMLEADGYLGLDTIDGFRVTFDFKNHALEIGEALSRSASYLIRSNEVRLRTYGSSGHLRAVGCTVAGVPASAFIDSGAEVSVGNPPLFAALRDHNPARAALGNLVLTGVTGGEIAGPVTMIDRIRLQELEFTNCALVIADLQVFDIWGLSRKPALLIGMNYLRQFSRVSIDYGLKEIRFDRASLLVGQPT
jgi:predicted aspartyl protease